MERRGFLYVTGLTAMAGWTPPPVLGRLEAAGAQQGGATASEASWERRLAEYGAAVRFERLPPAIIGAAKAHLLDTLGCACGGVGSEPARIVESTFRRAFGSIGRATVIGGPDPITTEGAALVNGVLTRVLDFNDTYSGLSVVHPSEVIPTALACSEEAGLDGRRLLEAIVVGYEAETRLADAFAFAERGFYGVSTGGVAVPLIAAKCLGLSPEIAAHAIGISFARQLTLIVVSRGDISMMKALPHGHIAMDGIFAARLAQGGFTGPSGAIAWFATEVQPKTEPLVIDVDPAQFSLDRVAFKRFPLQIQLQTVVEAATRLAPRLKGRASDIQRIDVGTYPEVIRTLADPAKYRPASRETADHSLPVCAAMALLDGDVTLAHFEKERWKADDVLAMAAKVTVTVSDVLVAKTPRGRGATLTIRLAGGESLSETVEIPEGDPRKPFSRESLERKFLALAEPVLGQAGAAKVIEIVAGLESLKDVKTLTQALH